MAQAFLSTYQNHYRWRWQPRPLPFIPGKLTNLALQNDCWNLNLNLDLDEELANLPKIKQAIYNLYLKRMRTTYKISHCENLKLPKKSSETNVEFSHQDEFENELLEYCHKLYGSKHKKPIPPLNTARNVFGYMRPARLMTSLTSYQNDHGKVAYKILVDSHKDDWKS
ncbi:unnamed protein product [Ceutorhynchus assimilis]|uniref:Uncharacterized protein n=1 Tax=Ceutorhynchus assimilis TaxID=467358 RepID=A0A9N9QD48_9CUCU|nr:unnamed protein product [Ceutorhynchus assimilis]